MDETQIGILVGLAAVSVLCLVSMIREVLLKREREKWRSKFERRNREDEWF